MSFTFLRELPSPEEIKKEYPLSDALKEVKRKRDQEIADVFTGKSDKFIVIIGPCSACLLYTSFFDTLKCCIGARP